MDILEFDGGLFELQAFIANDDDHWTLDCWNLATDGSGGHLFSVIRRDDDELMILPSDKPFPFRLMDAVKPFAEEALPPFVSILVSRWIDDNEQALEESGVSLSRSSSAPGHNPSSVILDFETARANGRVVIWSDGQAQLNAGSTTDNEILLDEHRADVNTPSAVDAALQHVVRIVAAVA